MSNKVIIDDNFLSKNEIESIQNVIYRVPYFYNPSTGTPYDSVKGIGGEDFTDYPMFVSGANTVENRTETSDLSMYILDKFIKKNNIKVKNVFRAKSNITFTTLDRRPSRPHIDSDTNHHVFLYYVFDSDGDTILYNEFNDGTSRNPNDLTIQHEVSPVAGKAILFDGQQYHTWKAPLESSIRCVINMNIELEN